MLDPELDRLRLGLTFPRICEWFQEEWAASAITLLSYKFLQAY